MFSSGYQGNLFKIKRLISAKVLVPQVLELRAHIETHRATDLGQWFRGQRRVSQKQADKYPDGSALPHFSELCTGTRTQPCIYS